jgi:hypothetical protein
VLDSGVWPTRLGGVEDGTRDRPFRLHDRLIFARDAVDAPWATEKLFP